MTREVTRRACGSCQRYGKRHRVCADSSVSACVSHTALDGARAAHKAPRGGAILAIKPTSIQVDKYLRKTVTTVDEEKTDTERVWSNNYDRVVGSLNAFGGLTFILGTLFASAFFLCNLE